MTLVRENIPGDHLTDDGTLDESLGEDDNGMATASLGGNEVIYALALQSDGKIIAVGKCVNIAYNTAMARFNADGTIDDSFSGDGIMAVSFTGTPQAYAVAVQSDGGIVAVGKRTATYTEFAIARVMGGPVLEERLFAIHDANYNVTGIVDAEDGSVVERYVYTPYGTRTVIDADWTSDDDGVSDVANDVGHQGLVRDPETGLVYNRARYLQTSVGRFTVRDFIGYGDGMNVYQYVGSKPIEQLDSSGLAADCCQDMCTWGTFKNVTILGVALWPALHGGTPKTVETGVALAIDVGDISTLSNVLNGAQGGVNAIDAVINEKMYDGWTDAMINKATAFQKTLRRNEGVAIFVNVQWDQCENEWCFYWFPYRRTNFSRKSDWYKCDAAPSGFDVGFPMSDKAGIRKAIRGCLLDAAIKRPGPNGTPGKIGCR